MNTEYRAHRSFTKFVRSTFVFIWSLLLPWRRFTSRSPTSTVWPLDFSLYAEKGTGREEEGMGLSVRLFCCCCLLPSLEDVEQLAGPLAVVQVERVVSLRRRRTQSHQGAEHCKGRALPAMNKSATGKGPRQPEAPGKGRPFWLCSTFYSLFFRCSAALPNYHVVGKSPTPLESKTNIIKRNVPMIHWPEIKFFLE